MQNNLQSYFLVDFFSACPGIHSGMMHYTIHTLLLYIFYPEKRAAKALNLGNCPSAIEISSGLSFKKWKF